MFFVAAYYCNEIEEKRQENIKRRRLRDHSNPLEVAESAFIAYYRINKDAFRYILEEITPFLKATSVPMPLKLATTLRFLAEGGYQRAVGKDSTIALERSSVSKILSKVLTTLERVLCAKWIKLTLTSEEQHNCKIHFCTKFGIPGVIGCIDGTHVKLIKPIADPHLYYNRKGCFSVNAMLICDHTMKIRAVDSCHPGSSHDSFVFNMSKSRQFLVNKFEAGERNSWLLGDSGYGIEPFLFTPYRDPAAGSSQHRFNKQHAKARNIIERVIGVLKSRLRCLQLTLPYSPQRVVKIMNVCCALHNICKFYNVENCINDAVDLNDERSNQNNDDNLAVEEEPLIGNNRYQAIAISNRDNIMQRI